MLDMPPLSCLTTPNRPDFLILGVQKSATTALFDVLDGLEGFAGSSSKELHFFDNDSFLDYLLDDPPLYHLKYRYRRIRPSSDFR